MTNVVIDFGNGEDLVEYSLPVVPLVGETMYIDDITYRVIQRDFTINEDSFHASLLLKKAK